MVNQDTLKTIWEVPDDLWEEIERLIAELDPPKDTGRKRADPRKMLNAIIFRMRSGCQWNQLPAHLGDDSTVHRTLQRWESIRLFPRMWELIQTRCEELKVVDWEWQSADTSMGKARWGGCGWPKPHRPRQARNQAQYPCRGEWKASERRGGGRERTRHQAVGGDAGECGGRESRANRAKSSASVSGQRI